MASRFTGELPHHPFYEYERELGDIIARLHTIRKHAEVAKDHADNADLRYPDDSLNQIYAEMDEQLKTLEEFKDKLLKFQKVILGEIKGSSEEGGGQILPFRKVS